VLEVKMPKAKQGDRVKIHYEVRLEDGKLLDSSKERMIDQPIEFTIGSGKFLAAFEQAIIGMGEGEKKNFVLPNAYGPKREELIRRVKRSDLPRHLNLAVGREILVRQPGGQIAEVIVSEIKGEMITLDQNNPLAGKTLVFDIELVEVL
jgi:FKBP-type peptidyl-prolyl cis-trans isomerase 2